GMEARARVPRRARSVDAAAGTRPGAPGGRERHARRRSRARLRLAVLVARQRRGPGAPLAHAAFEPALVRGPHRPHAAHPVAERMTQRRRGARCGFALCLGLACVASGAASAVTSAGAGSDAPALAAITDATLRGHVAVLASDAFRGRFPGT